MDGQELVTPFKGRCMAVLLWGSYARGEATERSDMDVCVVAGPEGDAKALQSRLWRMPVDGHVFERMPDFLRAEVLRNHRILWCDDEPALAEYLRPYWKRWRTQAARNRLDRDEALAILRG